MESPLFQELNAQIGLTMPNTMITDRHILGLITGITVANSLPTLINCLGIKDGLPIPIS